MELKVTKVEEQSTFKGFKFKIITDDKGVMVMRVAEDRPWIPPSTNVLTTVDKTIVWKHMFKVDRPLKFKTKEEAISWLMEVGQHGVENAITAPTL